MTYLTIDNKESLIETILSVEHSLSFITRRKLIMKMRSIGFIEDDRYDEFGFCWIRFKGEISEQIITLNFTNNLNDKKDKLFYLTEKSFYKSFGKFTLQHRENDLPSKIIYGTANDIENNKSFCYNLKGEGKRINIKDPITVDRHDRPDKSIQYSYYIPEKIVKNDIYLDSIIIENDKIKSAVFQDGKMKLNLEKLKSIIPSIEQFSLNELIEINDRLSSEEKSLIQMVNV
jgi:hypothetical protein